MKLYLSDLVAPLSAAEFLEKHWLPETPAISRASPAMLEALHTIPELRDIDALLAAFKGPVNLFGPNAFRSSVPANVAGDFLACGFNLYIAGVEAAVPKARELMIEIGAQLGASPSQIAIEAFAGRDGNVSSRHYDHDINFQILLNGDKQWKIERNRNIVNPLLPYHPTTDRQGLPIPFPEEAYAHDRAIQTQFDKPEMFAASAGSVIFLPRGYWHEVSSRSVTFGLNLVIRGVTFASAFSQALASRLHQHAAFRGYLDGLASGQAAPPSRAKLFAELKQQAMRELEKITIEEAAFANQGTTYKWVVKPEIVGVELKAEADVIESIELDEQTIPHVRALAALRHPFTWTHALAACNTLTATALFNLIGDLRELGFLDKVEKKV